jgi:hypothetical protein
MPLGRLDVVGDDYALARSQTVVLHNVGRAGALQRLLHLVGGGARVRPRGGDVGGGHDVLGERLRPFELRGRAGRAEARDSLGAYGIRHARHERRLGADDDEVGFARHGQGGHRGRVERIHLGDPGDLGDARVAGCGDQLADGGIAGQGGGQCVLAGPRADQQYAHSLTLSGLFARPDGGGGQPVAHGAGSRGPALWLTTEDRGGRWWHRAPARRRSC